jgi:hypothetical protein
MKEESKLKEKQAKCKHEFVTFVDRVDKTKDIFCWKCGKERTLPYSKKF